MNKNGQILVFFVILIPILIAVAAFAIDMGFAYYESNKLHGINRMVIKYGLNHIEDDDVREKMVDLLYKNDNEIDSYDLEIEGNKIILKVNKSTDSFFGKLMNNNFYYISSKYVGYFKNNKIMIEKG